MSQRLKPMSVLDLFSSDQYVIPPYQRNYAWGEAEIVQIIDDIHNQQMLATQEPVDYHIGTLVVHERESTGTAHFAIIDGQQRLTTINIIRSVLKNEFRISLSGATDMSNNLTFDSRPLSTVTLKQIYEKSVDQIRDTDRLNGSIIEAYSIANRRLKTLFENREEELRAFCNYLSRHVKILRVPVPPDTNLNHYFEIMNSRGEQLEKHEVLKARLLGYLKHDPQSRYCFNLIWEACANMEQYVQYGFSRRQRDVVFGHHNWNQLSFASFEALLIGLGDAGLETDIQFETLDVLLNQKGENDHREKGEQQEEMPRFSSVISFPNFLLHVLRITREEDIPLDDKQLLRAFEGVLNRFVDDRAAFAKEFAFQLLTLRHQFDQYVIRRDSQVPNKAWMLQRLKYYEHGNKGDFVYTFGHDQIDSRADNRVSMLLAMFHVSTPTQNYKHWLNAVLKYLYNAQTVSEESYSTFLELLARAFAFNIYLTDSPKSYFNLTYGSGGLKLDCGYVPDLLDQGTSVPNFVFNFVDYLLWRNGRPGADSMQFTPRSSVEHFYPRNPKLEADRLNDKELLDSFGNLCLISASKNSSLSNYMPNEKRAHYRKVEFDSLKQRVMMDIPVWDASSIRTHGDDMKQLILEEYKLGLKKN